MWLWTLLPSAPNGDVTEGRGAEDTDDNSDEKPAKAGKLSGFALEHDAACKIARGLGVHLEDLSALVEVKGETVRLPPVAERTNPLFGKEGTEAPVGKKTAQMTLPGLLGELEHEELGWTLRNAAKPGVTTLDRPHQAMILSAADRGEALRRFLVGDGVGKNQKFWRLARALCALYPPGTDERRWAEGVLARKKGLGRQRMSIEQTIQILRSLVALPRETEWLEFKHNDAEPEEIGEYLSALSNSAALHEKKAAYLVWGVESATRSVVGTNFRPRARKIGNEDLEPWLARHLHPAVHFTIHEFSSDSKPVVLLSIEPCTHTPVRWKDFEYIRVGSYKKKLRDYPEKERALWARISRTTFEKEMATRGLSAEEALAKLDYPSYFEMLEHPVPSTRSAILARLETECMIRRAGDDRWDVTNFGAILFARKLSDFETLARKAIRVIVYKGRTETVKEQIGARGYSVGFEGLISYITDQLPGNEEIGKALRRNVRLYPEIAIRELTANAIIHQDFSLRGVSPMVEIFSDRIEITNPGRPLIDTLRFIDEPPRSRNEALAAFMRRVKICEERGSGIDKVVSQAELYQLPAPEFRVTEHHTIAILYAPRELRGMDRQDRIRACYQHAALQYVTGRVMTNASLRKRLGIEEKNYAIASRVIADTITEGLVKPKDPASTSKKHASYVPFWA